MGEACWRDFEKIQEMTSLYKKPLAANWKVSMWGLVINSSCCGWNKKMFAWAKGWKGSGLMKLHNTKQLKQWKGKKDKEKA